MQQILSNMALLDTLNYCKANNIDCSGTRLVKYPRKFTYALRNDAGKAIVTVTYYKNRIPSYFITPTN